MKIASVTVLNTVDVIQLTDVIQFLVNSLRIRDPDLGWFAYKKGN